MDVGPKEILVALGGLELAKKVLGPSFDLLGKTMAEKAAANLGRVFEKARRRLGLRIDQPGGVPPRVLKEVLQNAPFCEDELTGEYFGGVLASSRSGVTRDDRGAVFAGLVERLSTYQIRAHFVLYRFMKRLFDGTDASIGTNTFDLQIFVPLTAFSSAMSITEEERFDCIGTHAITGLATASLISDRFAMGSRQYLMEYFPPANVQDDGIIVAPSIVGAELFLWAHGLGSVHPTRFFDPQVTFQSEVTIQVTPGVRSLMDPTRTLEGILAGSPRAPSPPSPLSAPTPPTVRSPDPVADRTAEAAG